jgi:ferric-dicitrate binding protein FerR (iron transport regulator)
VWLNAASSIRFPTAFTSDRRVTITGEVYMEVAPDKAKPFIVKAANTEVQVLGTAFNINAYPDEATVKTTLVEGSVKIAGNVLKPGQAFKNGQLVSTNVEQDVAWKNGLFDFQDKDLREVMRQLARWYNINVIYENGIPEVEFGGQMGRNLKLSTVLTFLKKTNIHFKLEGNTLTVMP